MINRYKGFSPYICGNDLLSRYSRSELAVASRQAVLPLMQRIGRMGMAFTNNTNREEFDWFQSLTQFDPVLLEEDALSRTVPGLGSFVRCFALLDNGAVRVSCATAYNESAVWFQDAFDVGRDCIGSASIIVRQQGIAGYCTEQVDLTLRYCFGRSGWTRLFRGYVAEAPSRVAGDAAEQLWEDLELDALTPFSAERLHIIDEPLGVQQLRALERHIFEDIDT